MDNKTALPEPTGTITQENELILRDRLALVRTKLANERTLFAYLRTSLYLLTAGIGILEVDSIRHLKAVAYFSICFSSVLLLLGLWKFWRLSKQLRKCTTNQPFCSNRRREGEKIN